MDQAMKRLTVLTVDDQAINGLVCLMRALQGYPKLSDPGGKDPVVVILVHF